MHQVRPVRGGDGSRIWQLLRQFVTTYAPSEDAFAASFPKLLDGNGIVFLCVEDDGFLAGYILAHVMPTLFANGPILEIIECVVDEPRRSLGLGRVLVQAALAAGWTKGCVEATVPTRRAAAFYERLGFTRTAQYLKIKR